MKVLWSKSPRTAAEVVEALEDVEDWHPNTVKTLLSRLQRKGALKIDKQQSPHQFSAIVSERECSQSASESFLQKVFGGAVKPLLLHFVERQRVSQQDLDEMKDILKQKKR